MIFVIYKWHKHVLSYESNTFIFIYRTIEISKCISTIVSLPSEIDNDTYDFAFFKMSFNTNWKYNIIAVFDTIMNSL